MILRIAAVYLRFILKVTGLIVLILTGMAIMDGHAASQALLPGKDIPKMKKGKTYCVRIRAYKKSAGSTYYSDWSNVKKLKNRFCC